MRASTRPNRVMSRDHFCGLLLLIVLMLPAVSWGEETTRIVFDTSSSFNFASSVRNITPVGDQLFFAGGSGATGREAWRTDGTPEGTSMLMDLCPGPCHGFRPQFSPDLMVGFKGQLVFVSDGDVSRGLWQSDGPGLPIRLVNGDIVALAPLNEVLLFSRFDTQGRLRLWRSNGTPSSTRQVHTASPNRLTAAENRVFFHTEPSLLWTSDGTESGTHLVQDLGAGNPIGKILPVGDLVIVLTLDGQVWRSDGTTAERIASLSTSQEFLLWEEPTTSTQVFFTVFHGSEDQTRIWRSDGSADGTFPLPIPCERRCSFGGPISWALSESGWLFARVRDFSGTSTLWVSDGTIAGTRKLHDLAEWNQVVAVGDRAFYVDYPEFERGVLWTSDGTTAGTRALREITFAEDYDIYALRLQGGMEKLWAHLYRPSQNQTEIWQSDGTEAGTLAVATVEGRGSDALTFFRGLYYFMNESPAYGFEPWVSDGTQAGTRLLADITGEGDGLSPMDLVATRSQLYFQIQNQDSRRLWKSDGTAVGTELLPEIRRQPDSLIPIDEKLLVGDELRRLWITDGTNAGTELLREDLYSSEEWARLGDQVYFLERRNPENGNGGITRLWRSDGTSVGTEAVYETRGQVNPFWEGLIEANGRLFFSTNTRDRSGFWTSDGNAAGTAFIELPFLPERPQVLNGSLYFTDPVKQEVWTSDGTPEGTRRILQASQIEPSADLWLIMASEDSLYLVFLEQDVGSIWRLGSSLTRLGDLPSVPFAGRFSSEGFMALGDTVFFTVAGRNTGAELWRADRDGVRQVVDICPGPCSADPQNARVIADRLYFAASDGFHGLEPWTSDGTAEGTRLLGDVNPGLASSNPREFTGFAEEIYFSAYHPDFGPELWAYDLLGDCLATAERACLNGGRFEVSVDWRSQHGGVMEGTGKTLPFSEQSNFFWFFNPENIELVTKILDGRTINGSYWMFYGALTDVEYRLAARDRLTGREVSFYNPPGEICGDGDILAFPEVDIPLTQPRTQPSENLDFAGKTSTKTGDGPGCQSDANILCLRDGRFRIEVEWRDRNTGVLKSGQVIPGTSESGYFWFFNQENLELIVKVLDGTSINGKFWVFYGALSDVEYTLTVTDLETDAVKTYHNPQGEICGVGDTQAFHQGS